MTEAALDPNEAANTAALRDAAREFDRAQIKQHASYHFAMVMGALTLWGAAVTWAEVTGWGIAEFAAVNGAYAQFFPGDPPARAVAEVTGLPKGALVAMEAVADVSGAPA